MHTQPAVTLKYWKMVCAILSAPKVTAQSHRNVDSHLLYVTLIANHLSKLLIGLLSEAEPPSESGERNLIYTFALLVPVLSSLCTLLQQSASSCKDSAPQSNNNVKLVVNKCFSLLKEVFTKGLEHQSAKVVQTSISSMQNLIQTPVGAILSPVVVPCLLVTLCKQPSTIPEKALESAWGVISALVIGQQSNDSSQLLELTTGLVVKTVLKVADYSKQHPGSFTAHTAAMAQCLVQVARADQKGLKAEVSTMSAESQQTIQTLLREHMMASNRGAADAPAAQTQAAPKVELKLKF